MTCQSRVVHTTFNCLRKYYMMLDFNNLKWVHSIIANDVSWDIFENIEYSLKKYWNAFWP